MGFGSYFGEGKYLFHGKNKTMSYFYHEMNFNICFS